MVKLGTVEWAIFILKNYPMVKITHKYFSSEEYFYSKDDGNAYDENNYLMDDWESDDKNGMRIRTEGNFKDGWYFYNINELTYNDIIKITLDSFVAEIIEEAQDFTNPYFDDIGEYAKNVAERMKDDNYIKENILGGDYK